MNKLRRFLRRVRRVLAGADPTIPPGLFAHQTQVFYRIQFLIRGFYAFLAFTAILLVPEWPGILDRGSVDPLWPVFWMTHLNLRFGIGLVLGLYTVGALLAAALPQFRWTRALAFLGLLEYWAFNNSFGKVGHSLHDTLLVTFVFVFLPVGWHENDQHRRLGRQETLLVFWLAQCTIMVTYSMAGFIKVVAGVAQLLKGEPNLFWPDALARQVADRLLQTNSQSWWGDWLVTHPGLSYPMLRAGQIAVTWALGGLDEWRRNKRREFSDKARAFRSAMAEVAGWEIASIGAYFAYVRHPYDGLDAEVIAERLATETGLLLIPGSFFGPGQERYLRLSFGNLTPEGLLSLPTRFRLGPDNACLNRAAQV